MTVWLLLLLCRVRASELLSTGGLAYQAMQAEVQRLQEVCAGGERGRDGGEEMQGGGEMRGRGSAGNPGIQRGDKVSSFWWGG